MKGFVVILAAMAVFVAAFIAISSSAPQAQGASFNESFSGAKLMLTDIELSTIMAAQDCNWDKAQPIGEIQKCIDSNAQAIIDALSAPYTKCLKSNTKATNTSSSQAFSFGLDCIVLVEDKKGTIFKNEFSRTISGKKY